MGQSVSSDSDNFSSDFTAEEISKLFARSCSTHYSQIELWAFKELFHSLSEKNDVKEYWAADTLVRFLGIPDDLEVNSLLCYIASFLAEFPIIHFENNNNNARSDLLTLPNLLKVITLLSKTRRNSILFENYNMNLLLFIVFARYEKEKMDIQLGVQSEMQIQRGKQTGTDSDIVNTAVNINDNSNDNATGNINANTNDNTSANANEDVEDIENTNINNSLVNENDVDTQLYSIKSNSIKSWHTADVIITYNGLLELFSNSSTCPKISLHTLYKLIKFLLAIFPLRPQDSASSYIDNFTEEDSKADLRESAKAIITSLNLGYTVDFDNLHNLTISYDTFSLIINSIAPHVFDPLGSLFEHMLFSPKQLFDNANPNTTISKEESDSKINKILQNNSSQIKELRILPFLEQGKLLTFAKSAQLVTYFDFDTIWGKLSKLYTGSDSGFSMRSFETKVFKWNAPTILLISGEIIDKFSEKKAQNYLESIQLSHILKNSATHFSSSDDVASPQSKDNDNKTHYSRSTKVVYGVILYAPWRSSSKSSFANSQTVIFQLEPVQDFFTALPGHTNYGFYSNIASNAISFGSPLPKSVRSAVSSRKVSGANSSMNNINLFIPGDVSLTINDSLEYGIFKHVGPNGSGAFHASKIRPNLQWEDVFEITEVEVWGIGGTKELDEQAKRWRWENMEAERRRNIHVRNNGFDEDRALLELAGIIGTNKSGGSI